jgi:osmotically inducible lipoprotein OsmB
MSKTRFPAAVAAILVVAGSLSACAGMTPREHSTAVGAGVGAAAGALVTGTTAGAVGGAAVGGIVGNQIKR